jgi:hypothetical protein
MVEEAAAAELARVEMENLPLPEPTLAEPGAQVVEVWVEMRFLPCHTALAEPGAQVVEFLGSQDSLEPLVQSEAVAKRVEMVF